MNISTADVFNPRPKVVKAFAFKFNVKAKIGTLSKEKKFTRTSYSSDNFNCISNYLPWSDLVVKIRTWCL